MKISNSDKALLITISSASILVLVFFFLGVKPYQGELEEEFIEMAVLTEPIPEDQEDLLSEMPDISSILSNQLYDPNQLEAESKALDADDEVRKAIEARQEESIQNLDADNEARRKALLEEQDEHLEAQRKDLEEAIAARESNRGQKKQSKYRQSTVSYNLVDRTAIKLPNPVYTCDAIGKVVINITVNGQGSIIKKSFNSTSSSSSNGCLIEQAMKYLENAYFDNSPKLQQLGTVTFIFQG
ncbi:hypothetical protein [Dokdonia sp. Hel_I_53]|uniref:hypothetical protein n=1 Tax=Dokdonia sp. Hel_I_53 TaxID=1566287 RepID=UPI00119A9E4D|nr:hypothetical protein [Dokdonia sp. Hel_I_53]TVZ52765.1 hypothetical protein OD90_1949 [Dokdonia sp. Hel_I_53]